MTSIAPSGTQWEIQHGQQRAVVVEVGGGLREYTIDGAPVLDGYALDRMADGGRGQPLLPWPNRLADGQYTFNGQAHQLPIEEVDRNNAMHGLTRWLNWRLVTSTASSVRVELVVHPRSGYPFMLAVDIEYSLTDLGLTVRTRARNVGTSPLPFGAGQHPYFTVGTPLVDSAVLQIPVRGHVELDPDRLLPTGAIRPIAGTELDYTTPRQIGTAILDDCFTDLVRDADGRARVQVVDPATGHGVSVWLGDGYRYLQVFTGDTLSPERRRQGLAVEPMTCPPNAFHTGTDVITLEPDQSVELEWGVSQVSSASFTPR
ncbi:MAG TPA: aldose 1-epimerase family protein [Chloroflexota bacterium]|nr:aldose 1-epimerase family protein [Chloroflexota bacterium]